MTLEGGKEQVDLGALVAARFEQSTSVPAAFFNVEAERIAQACWAMARRFHQGGRLLALGNGASASDAQHVSVEFVHPVIVGKRALPAVALTNDGTTLSGLMAGIEAREAFARILAVLARSQDIALGFSVDGNNANVIAALKQARSMGLLTLALVGGDGGQLQQMAENEAERIDFCFVVRAQDPLVIQETHETLYHILWELVHIFFEHEGLFM